MDLKTRITNFPFIMLTSKNIVEAKKILKKKPAIFLDFRRGALWSGDPDTDENYPFTSDAKFTLLGDGIITPARGDGFWLENQNGSASKHPLSRDYLLSEYQPPKIKEECEKIDSQSISLATSISTHLWQQTSETFPKLLIVQDRYKLQISKQSGASGLLLPPFQGTLWIRNEEDISVALNFALTYMTGLINNSNAERCHNNNPENTVRIEHADIMSVIKYAMDDLRTGEVVKETTEAGVVADATWGFG